MADSLQSMPEQKKIQTRAIEDATSSRRSLTQSVRIPRSQVIRSMVSFAARSAKCLILLTTLCGNCEISGVLKDACDAAGVSMADAAMRWCKHHSILDASVGDGIIFGASSSSHAEHNIAAYGAGPLPDSIVEAMDAACVVEA